MTPCKTNTHFLRDIKNLGYKSFESVYDDKLMLTFSDMLMLTGQLDFLHLFQSCPKSLTLDPWKEWKNAKSVPIDDTWESQLPLWSLAPGLCCHFSIAACHGLVEYRVCSSQPDSWSCLKREDSGFGPTEAKAGIESQSLTYCSLQSIELWILHLLLLLHADLYTSSALSLPAGASPRGTWVKVLPLSWKASDCAHPSCFCLSRRDTEIQSGTSDF